MYNVMYNILCVYFLVVAIETIFDFINNADHPFVGWITMCEYLKGIPPNTSASLFKQLCLVVRSLGLFQRPLNCDSRAEREKGKNYWIVKG